MTSSYLRTFLRISKFCCSTLVCARSIDRETIFASIGMSSGMLEPLHDRRHRDRRRTGASARRRATGRSASRRGRPDVRSVRGAGCRSGATRDARCRSRTGHRARRPSCARAPTPPSCSRSYARTNSSNSVVSGSRPCASASCLPSNSGLPPRMMSTPRPAMFVATVTGPAWPACAMISASFSCRPRASRSGRCAGCPDARASATSSRCSRSRRCR